MVRQERGEVARELGGQVQPTDLGDFRRRPGAPDAGSGEDGGLDLGRRLIRGVRQPVAQQVQPVGGQHDAHFFLQLARCGLGGAFAGLGFAAGMHELVRAAFADGQQASGAIKDADGGDHNAGIHSAGLVSGPGSAGAAAAAGSSRRRDDSSSWSLAGPVTSQR